MQPGSTSVREVTSRHFPSSARKFDRSKCDVTFDLHRTLHQVSNPIICSAIAHLNRSANENPLTLQILPHASDPSLWCHSITWSCHALVIAAIPGHRSVIGPKHSTPQFSRVAGYRQLRKNEDCPFQWKTVTVEIFPVATCGKVHRGSKNGADIAVVYVGMLRWRSLEWGFLYMSCYHPQVTCAWRNGATKVIWLN